MDPQLDAGERKGPRGLLRWLLRAPLVLYRLRLGWLLGETHLLLRHPGRRTGRVRQTVLEVVTFDVATRERVVASYWGTGSDWWRNVVAGGAVEVVVPGERFEPSVRILDEDERIDALRRYRTERPMWAWVGARTFGLPWGTDSQALERTARRLPMVAFTPRRTPGGGGLD